MDLQFDPPSNEIGRNCIESEVLKLGEKRQVPFEMICRRLEAKFCDAELGIVCRSAIPLLSFAECCSIV